MCEQNFRFGEDTKASFYLRTLIERISSFNNWSPDRQCLIAAYGGSYDECNTVFFALSRALVGREIFWHALRTNARRHLEQNDEFYRKLFQLKLDDKAYTALINGCTIGSFFKKAYAENTYTTIVPLLSTEPYKLPEDLIPNSKYVVSSLGVLIRGLAGYLNVGNGINMDMNVTSSMCYIMAKKCIQQENINVYIAADYCENVLRQPYYKLSVVKKLKQDLQLPPVLPSLYRCLICWRLSRMPDIDQSILTSGSILYEKIRCLLVDVPDGLEVAILPVDECGFRQGKYFLLRISPLILRTCEKFMRFHYLSLNQELRSKQPIRDEGLELIGYQLWPQFNYMVVQSPGKGEIPQFCYIIRNGKKAQQRFFLYEAESRSVDVIVAQFTTNFVETHYKEERNNIEFYEEVKTKIVPQVEALCKFSNSCLTDSFWSPVDMQNFTWVPPERINREKLTFEMLFENDKFLVSPIGPISFIARQKFNNDNTVTPMPIRLTVSDGRTVIVLRSPSKIGPPANLNCLLEKLIFLDIHNNAKEVLYKSCGSSAPVIANKKSEYKGADQYIIVLEKLTIKQIDKAANKDLQNVVQLIYDLSSAIALRQLSLTLSGTTKLWEYLEKRPQLFVHDGLFYRILRNTDTISFPSHFEFPGILPDINFYFSKDQRCLYLCLPNIGHLQIDAKLRQKIREALEKRFHDRSIKFVEDTLLSIKLPFFKSLDVNDIISQPKNCGAALIM
uniref:Uncharacterized protein n=1 Tax=Romanomermis culicivorax TaxID=13658 RepID=A0A915I692_ROMCU